ncbi:hypothetical protein [Exiguobacterium sp. TNDT2]|uniref:hypothetical protein n=1 Tax=Exiguobacterium sp. TNDT2 TaxID=2233531 RepID=UPI000DEF4F1A|nr:hypothetical protein [Exiguobacterium sp. TNDT2]
MLIEEMNKLYSEMAIEIQVKEIASNPLLLLSKSISRLKVEIDSNYQSYDDVNETLFYLRKVLSKFTTSLLNYNEILKAEEKKHLQLLFSRIRKSYNALYKSHFVDVTESLKGVLEMNENSLTNEVIHNVHTVMQKQNNIKLAIVTKKSLNDEEKEKLITRLNKTEGLNFFTENGFRNEARTYDYTIYIGSPKYCSSYTANTFKSKNVLFIAYDFYDNNFVLREPLKGIGRSQTVSTIYKNVEVINPSIDTKKYIFRDPLEPSEMLNRFIQRAHRENSNEIIDVLEAMVVYLENNRFIFIPKNTKIKTVSAEGKVTYTKVNNLEENSYIIIRNRSDSKLVAEIADLFFLKEKTDEFRNIQSQWKEKLKSISRKFGVNRMSQILRTKYSIKYATPNSLKNWMKEDTIEPRALEELLTILKYSDQEKKKTLTATKEIRSAHQKAGRLISDKLMKDISTEMLETLKEKGYHTFESKEFNDVTFNIERVIYVDNAVKEVSINQIMKLHKLL